MKLGNNSNSFLIQFDSDAERCEILQICRTLKHLAQLILERDCLKCH